MAYEVKLAPNESVERWQVQSEGVVCTNSIEELKSLLLEDKMALFVCVPTRATYEERFKNYPDKEEYRPDATICTGLVDDVVEDGNNIIVLTQNSAYLIID